MNTSKILQWLVVSLTILFSGCGPSQISEEDAKIDESVVLPGDADDAGGSPTDE